MVCEKCGKQINSGDEMHYSGKTLCEDCYIDTLSPTRTCDPWAVYTAKSFSGKDAVFNASQKRFWRYWKKRGAWSLMRWWRGSRCCPVMSKKNLLRCGIWKRHALKCGTGKRCCACGESRLCTAAINGFRKRDSAYCFLRDLKPSSSDEKCLRIRDPQFIKGYLSLGEFWDFCF